MRITMAIRMKIVNIFSTEEDCSDCPLLKKEKTIDAMLVIIARIEKTLTNCAFPNISQHLSNIFFFISMLSPKQLIF